jgi:RNA polymerase sigma factor (sigma-70 family)
VLSEDVAEAIGRKLTDAAVDVDARLDKLIECMKGLGRRDREILNRHYHKQQSVKHIAASLGVSESSIYKVLNRTRDALYDCIRQGLAEPTP